MFDKIDGFIRVYDGIIYLVLFGGEVYDFSYNRIRYLTGVKNGITYVISHNYAKVKIWFIRFLILRKKINFS